MTTKSTTEQRNIIPNRDQLLTIGDLTDFRDELLSAIKDLLKEHMGDPGKKWLKSNDVKKLLGISHNYLQQLRDSGKLPFIKIGGNMYYEVADIQKMMTAHRVEHEEYI
jgi:hypothetical protein